MRVISIARLACLALLAGAGAACSDTGDGVTTADAAAAHFGHNAQGGAAMGTTPGWMDGETVTFFYNKDFFCKEPPRSDAPSDCVLGAEAQVPPRGGNIPVLYVMVPLGFDPGNLHCPTTTCVNHPSTIDATAPVLAVLESVLGDLPDNGVIPVVPHSHIVDRKQGGWWSVEIIGVTDPAVWAQIAAAKSLDRVRQLQMAGAGITGDIPTNLFLFFSVRP